MTRSEIVAELFNLDAEDRLELAQILWDSVEAKDAPLTEAQLAEIQRRLDEMERDPSSAIPWEVVRARLWSRFE